MRVNSVTSITNPVTLVMSRIITCIVLELKVTMCCQVVDGSSTVIGSVSEPRVFTEELRERELVVGDVPEI